MARGSESFCCVLLRFQVAQVLRRLVNQEPAVNLLVVDAVACGFEMAKFQMVLSKKKATRPPPQRPRGKSKCSHLLSSFLSPLSPGVTQNKFLNSWIAKHSKEMQRATLDLVLQAIAGPGLACRRVTQGKPSSLIEDCFQFPAMGQKHSITLCLLWEEN